MLHYPLRVEVDNPGWLVQSRDIPQLTTGAPRGTTKEYATAMGYEAFRVVVELLMERGRAIPMPSECQVGEVIMPMDLNVEAKIRIWNRIVEKKLKARTIAMMIAPIKCPMSQFVDLDKPLSLDALVAFSTALDMKFTLSLQ